MVAAERASPDLKPWTELWRMEVGLPRLLKFG